MSESVINNVFDGPLSINEFRFTATADFRTTSNFVELLTEPGASLAGLTLLIINGEAPNGSTDNIGQITWAVDLSSATADENGYVLVGNDGLTSFFDIGDVIVQGFDPNGNAQTILVVRDFTGAVGDDLDTNDDGTFDVTPFGDVVAGLALRDEDRDPNVLYAEEVVQADPLDDGFISAGGARQPDGSGAFVTLPYDTPDLDTPGFANVADDPEAPEYDIQLGTIDDDRLTGLNDLSNLLVGKDSDDRLFGANEADVIFDGLGNDHILGRGGDDFLYVQGGAKDRATGGEGADVFKLAADYSSNGSRDKLTITDFDVSEDQIDLGRALISSVKEKATGTIIRLAGDNDVIFVRGVTEFDDIAFTTSDVPLTASMFEEIGEADLGNGNGATGLSLNTVDDGFRLHGSFGEDVFEFFGGEKTIAKGNGGSDLFKLNASMRGDGVADKIIIRDFGEDDVFDITGFEINRIKESDNRVQVFVGPDNDQLEFTRLSSADDIVFISDLVLG